MSFTHRGVGRVLAVSTLATVALVSHPLSAQSGIDACINPAGQMRMLAEGNSCRPQEQLVTWSIQGPQGPVGPQGQPGTSGPVVVDSTGARLGWYATPITLMNVGDQWFTVYANRDGFSSSLGIYLIYVMPDCTGSRYGTGGSGLVPNAEVLGQYAWYADLEAPPVIISGSPEAPGTFWFRQESASGPVGPCMPNAVFTTLTLRPLRSTDLSAFVPPFRLTN
jgi:hypothetical protein